MEDSCDIPQLRDETSKYSIVSANNINIMKKHLSLFKER